MTKQQSQNLKPGDRVVCIEGHVTSKGEVLLKEGRVYTIARPSRVGGLFIYVENPSIPSSIGEGGWLARRFEPAGGTDWLRIWMP